MKLIHYKGENLKAICIPETATLREAMSLMNESSLRLIPVVSADDNKLVGVLADGDLRRFLADVGDIDASVAVVCNRSPITIEAPQESRFARLKLMQLRVEYLPVVKDGRIVELFVLWATNAPLPLTAIIMAGGLGTRLAPYTDNCPKPLVELGGKPILTHIIEHLKTQGVTRFILSVNYLSQMIVDYYGDGSELDVSIEYVHETKRLGTGGALSLVASQDLSEPFICMNGDILTDIDLNALHDLHTESGWMACMVTREYQYTVPYGVVRKTEHGEFQGSDEKPTMKFPINAGIYMLSKEVLPLIPKNEYFDLPTLFEKVMNSPLTAGTYSHEGRWIDIGSVAELERARNMFDELHHD